MTWMCVFFLVMATFLAVTVRVTCSEVDTETRGARKSVRAPPFSVNEFRDAVVYDNRPVLELPSWHSFPHLRGLAEATRELPQPEAIVVYGSSVREGGAARDVDILWLLPGDGGDGGRSFRCNADYTYDDYGATTRNASIYHVAVASADQIHRQLRSGHEWAASLMRDGVLLASDTNGQWGRAFYRRLRGSVADIYSIADLTRSDREVCGA